MNQRLLTWLKSLFVENAYYKLFSLALVILLYAWVLGDRTSESTITLPVRLVIPQDRIITSQSLKETEVTFGGRLGAIERFNSSGEVNPILIDVPERTGDLTLAIDIDQIALPPGLTPKFVRPSSLRLTVEKRASKQVPVRPRTVGSLPKGYVMKGIKLDPSTATITGPAPQIERTSFLMTEPIDISGKTETFSLPAEARPDSPMVQETSGKPVEVTLMIEATEDERTFDKIPVLAVNTVRQTQIKPSTLSVTVRGPQSLLDSLDPTSIFATINLAGEGRIGVFEKSAEIKNLPKELKILRFYPQDFQVRTLPPTAAPPPP